jgi:hypothetical protein
MTEPGDEIEVLRAEREELRVALRRRTGMLHGAISKILLKQSEPSFPEEMARTIDDRIAPVRWAAGWAPYVRRPPRYESHPTPDERRVQRGLPTGAHPVMELVRQQRPDASDIDELRAERDELREALEHQIIMFQEALSNLYLSRRDADGHPVDVAFLYEVFEKACGTSPAILTPDGLPQWLDVWFTSTEQQPYVGMTMPEAVVEAELDDVDEVRLIHLPLRSDFRLDYHRTGSTSRARRTGSFAPGSFRRSRQRPAPVRCSYGLSSPKFSRGKRP